MLLPRLLLLALLLAYGLAAPFPAPLPPDIDLVNATEDGNSSFVTTLSGNMPLNVLFTLAGLYYYCKEGLEGATAWLPPLWPAPEPPQRDLVKECTEAFARRGNEIGEKEFWKEEGRRSCPKLAEPDVGSGVVAAGTDAVIPVKGEEGLDIYRKAWRVARVMKSFGQGIGPGTSKSWI